MTDLTLRAETPRALLAAIQSAPFRAIIGPVGIFGRGGKEVRNPNLWKPEGKLGRDIDYIYRRRNQVVTTPAVLDGNGDVVTPAVTDPWCWLLVRLLREAEAADFVADPADTEPDRWNMSRIRKWMERNGTLITPRRIRAWQYKFPASAPAGVRNKRVQIVRGSQMAALGLEFVRWAGGMSY